MSDTGWSEPGPGDPRSAEAEATGVQLIDGGPQDAQGQLVADTADEPAAPSEESILLDLMGSDAVGTAAEETAIRVEDEPPGGTDTASDGYVAEEGREP